MKNIRKVSKALLCSACGACSAACPRHAISFRDSSIGRKYAFVSDVCSNCGLCQKVCPSIDALELHKRYEDNIVGNVISVKVGKSQLDNYYHNAQSGGAAATIFQYLFDQKLIEAAVVTRMDYGETPDVKGVVITSISEINNCQKSCYTPVSLLEALRETKQYKSVAVVGLPCHIEGATLLMETLKPFRNITYRIGLICDRTLCSGICPAMKALSGINKDIKIDWRRKDFNKDNCYYPYKTAPVVVYSQDGDTKVMDNQCRFALKDMFTPPRCRVCADKLNVHADIVLGDPWGMSDIDWNSGESLIITRTQKGDELIRQMEKEKLFILSERPIEQVLEGQHIERRRKQLPAYGKVVSGIIKNDVGGGIYLCNHQGSIDNKMLKEAQREITAFVQHEKLSELEVIQLACDTVKQHLHNMELSGKLWYRILRKIKHIILK